MTFEPTKIVRRDGVVLKMANRAVEHLAAHPDITLKLIETAFQQITLPKGDFLKTEVDFGRVIGRSGRVETDIIKPDDLTDFAYRKGRRYPSRVAFTEKPDTQLLTVVATRLKPVLWRLDTAWIGPVAEMEPLSRFGKKPLAFWCRNALVYDESECATQPFRSSWRQLLDRLERLGTKGFPERGPYWMSDAVK